jgi:phage shock protein PspC (stress-responsive transcriptional regulator)
MKTRLTRSRSNRVLGGVCAGLGGYLGLDPTLVRLIFVVLALADGIAILIYLVLWILVPLEPMAGEQVASAGDLAQRAGQLGEEAGQAISRPNPQAGLWLGGALIVTGGVLFLRSLGISWLNWLDADVLWPLVLVAGGLALILRRREEA